jgi:hypothetical protein
MIDILMAAKISLVHYNEWIQNAARQWEIHHGQQYQLHSAQCSTSKTSSLLAWHCCHSPRIFVVYLTALSIAWLYRVKQTVDRCCFGKNLEGSGHGLIKAFALRDWGKACKTSVTIVHVLAKI